MAVIIKSLAAGTVPSGTTDIYTVPAGRSAVVNNVRVVNGNTTTSPAMNLLVKASGSSTTARRIHDKDFTLGPKTKVVIEDVVTLGEGDKIQLALNSVQTISYMVNGVEKE